MEREKIIQSVKGLKEHLKQKLRKWRNGSLTAIEFNAEENLVGYAIHSGTSGLCNPGGRATVGVFTDGKYVETSFNCTPVNEICLLRKSSVSSGGLTENADGSWTPGRIPTISLYAKTPQMKCYNQMEFYQTNLKS